MPLALALLALPPSSVPSAQELELAWQVEVEAGVPVPGVGHRAVGDGQLVAAAVEQLDGAGIVLELFDAAGTLLWDRTLLPPAGGAFVDLALAPDAGRLLLLTDGEQGSEPVLVVEAFDLADGAPSWSLALPEPAVGDGLDGALRVAAGRVAVVRSSRDLVTGLSQARVSVLEAVGGGEVTTTPPFVGVEPRVSLAPAGDGLVVWERFGAMAAYALPSGLERWSVVAPPAAPDGGLAALEFAADGALVVRADGIVTAAFDAADGGALWSQPAIQARDVAAYGADRVFVCGVDDGGGLGATPLSFGMLDVATGAVLWDGNRSDDLGVLSEPFETWTRAGVDPLRGRVALRQSGLWVLDAQSGVELGSAKFAGAATDATLGLLDDGSWVGWSGALELTGGTYVEAFDGLAEPLWSAQSLLSEPIGTDPVAVFAPAGGDRVHLWWRAAPGAGPSADFGRYELRDAATGALAGSWPFGVDPDASTVRPSPDGERLAVVEDLGGSIRITVRAIPSFETVGQLGFSPPFFASPGVPWDVVWAPDASAFATAARVGADLAVGVLDRDGEPRWLVELPPPTQSLVESPELVWMPEAGELLLGYGTGPGVVLMRLDLEDGALLGSMTWGAPPPLAPGSRKVGIWAAPDGSTAGAAIRVRESVTFGTARLDAVTFELATGAVLASRTVVPSAVGTDYERSGVALRPGGDLVLLGGTYDEDGQGLRPVRVDGLSLPDLATVFTDVDPNASLSNQVATGFVDGQVGVVRSAGLNFGQPASGRVELYDVTSGTTLAVFEGPDGWPVGAAGEQTGVAGGDALFALGRPSPASLTIEAVRVDLAALLAGPDLIAPAGGTLVLAIDGDADRAGHSFFTGLGFEGTEPGTPLGSIVVPLNGTIFSAVTSPVGGDAVWSASFGVLGPDGTGRAEIVLPPLPPALLGVLVHAAVVAVDPVDLDLFATPAAAVQLGR